MSKCEACGGDGQIEYGAYRGDDSTETRGCRLCGGAVTVYSAGTDVVGTVGSSAASAGESLKRLGQAAARTGVKIEQMVHKSSRSGSRVVDRVITFKTAKDYADERLEQLRQENEHRQREAESEHDNVSDTMNQFLRDRLKS